MPDSGIFMTSTLAICSTFSKRGRTVPADLNSGVAAETAETLTDVASGTEAEVAGERLGDAGGCD